MTPSMPSGRRRSRRAGVRSAGILCLALTAATACDVTDRLLSVTTPSRLGNDQYLVPENAQLIVNSAVADYECALGVYAVASGLAAGELADVSQTAGRWSYDRRDVLPGDATYGTASCSALGVYTPISTARFTADQALTALDGWTDAQVANRARLVGTAALYAGFAYTLLAEGFCTAAVSGGPELTTEQLLDSADARFTRAIASAQASGDTLALSAAHAGRARARIDRGDAAGAASDAAAVRPSFVALNATADNTNIRRQNRVFAENNNTTNGVTVAAAYRALTVQGAPDPRVRVTNANRLGGDQINPLFRQAKFGSLTAPIPVVSRVESQLILAEARGGAEGVSIINSLRARPGVALPPLTAAEAADFRATLFEERRRELFLQGNRWFDLRRGNLPLAPAAGTPYAKGGSYGTQRCWPLPDVERAGNPSLRT